MAITYNDANLRFESPVTGQEPMLPASAVVGSKRLRARAQRFMCPGTRATSVLFAAEPIAFIRAIC